MNKAIFLDRDGVINELNQEGFVTSKKQVKFLHHAAKALELLVKTDYKIIVITNQPVVGRGIITEAEYEDIENFFLEQVKQKGGRIDACYKCFHHPKYGIGKYLQQCECRKPKPGMIIKAAKDHNINLEESWMIGDSRGDMNAGRDAGCKTILVQTGYGGKGGDTDLDAKPDHEAEDLLAAVQFILKA